MCDPGYVTGYGWMLLVGVYIAGICTGAIAELYRWRRKYVELIKRLQALRAQSLEREAAVKQLMRELASKRSVP